MEFNRAVYAIEPGEIHQGDLAFIVHKTKPTKTGWWRKVRMKNVVGEKNTNIAVEYVLEKAMHKNFRPEDFENSRQEDGIFIMGNGSLCSDQYSDNYEILFQAKGVASVLVINNGYMPTEKLMTEFRSDFKYTNKGVELFNYYNNVTINPMEELAKNLIRRY